METRHYIGLALVAAGVFIQPIGWIFYTWLSIISFVLIALGLFIFLTQKVIEKLEAKEMEERRRRKNAICMPGDIHDYSGWGKAGRSTAWDSSSGDGGGDGGGGD